MKKRRHSATARVIALLLIAALFLPVGSMVVSAESLEPRASNYINTLDVEMAALANGKIRVYFFAQGYGYLDALGATSIRIYESSDGSSWVWRKTFNEADNSQMMSYNDYFHSGSVDYQGVVGKYYRAHVYFWGGSDGQGDIRNLYTNTVQAVVTPS